MLRTSFDRGWSVRPKVRAFLESTTAGADWAPVDVPHDAMLGLLRDPSAGPASGYFPGGVWEYRKSFALAAEDADRSVLLELEGVYRDAVVTVNGELAAHRASGYTQIIADLTPYARFGEDNEVVVEASAGSDSRWYSGAGIYRHTWLVVGGPLRVALDGVRVTTLDADADVAVLEVRTTLENTGRSHRTPVLLTEVCGASGVVTVDRQPVTVPPQGSAVAVQRLTVAGPQRWSVDEPHLHTCRTVLLDGDDEIDTAETTFGIRTVTVDTVRGLRLNGETVLLRGGCVHHDNGVLGAATIGRAEERRVELLKAAGFNALRSAHQPMSRSMLDACDRIGMLVMDEAFDMWTRHKTDQDYARDFPQWWEADLEAMVVKDANHPSVVMYSIGNEIPEVATTTGRLLSRAMADTLRRLDPSRLVTAGVNAMLACQREILTVIGGPASADAEVGINTQLANLRESMAALMRSDIVTERTAEAFATLDVAGYNYMHSRYRGEGELFPHRVVVGSETMPSDIDRNWRDVRDLSYVIGDFTWTAWDYLGEAGIGRVEHGGEPGSTGIGVLGAYPWLTAWTGDLDITGHRRPASYYRQIVFGLRSDPYVVVQPPELHGQEPSHTSPWSWPDVVPRWSWAGHEGAPVQVVVYADADEVELLLDGRSLGRQPAGEDARFTATFDVTYAPGELVAVALVDGVETGRAVLRTPSAERVLAARSDRDQVRADDSDLAFVTIDVSDPAGTPHLDDERDVTVAVDGPAVLQGLGSGDPRGDARFDGASCRLYEGRALAVVRPTGPGRIRVAVTTQDGDTVTCELEAGAVPRPDGVAGS